MAFIEAGQRHRINVQAGQTILVTTESQAQLTFASDSSTVVGIAAPNRGANATAFGPFVQAGDVEIASTGLDVEYEVFAGDWRPATDATIPTSRALISMPTPEMIADVTATYRDTLAPYDRYRSNGVTLVNMSSGEASGSFRPVGLNIPVAEIDGLPPVDELLSYANKNDAVPAQQVVTSRGRTLEDELAEIRGLLNVPSTSAPTNPGGADAPVITGSNTVGSSLTLGLGTNWTGTPTFYVVTLTREGLIAPIYTSGQITTAPMYIIQNADQGKKLVINVVANNGLPSVSVPSAAFTVAAATGTPWTIGTASPAFDSKLMGLDAQGDGLAVFIAKTYITASTGTPTQPTPTGTPATPQYWTNGTGTSRVVTAPTGAAASAVAVVHMTFDEATAVPVTLPDASWVERAKTNIPTGDGQCFATFTRQISGAMPANFTFTLGSDEKTTAVCYALTSVDPTNMLEWPVAVGSSASAGASPRDMDVTPGAATGYANSLIVYAAAADPLSPGNQVTGHTPPTVLGTWTELFDANGNTYIWCPITVAYIGKAAAGAIGTVNGKVVMSSQTAAYAAHVLAFRGVGAATGLAANGAITKRPYTGTWGAETTVYSSDGVSAAADEYWFTNVGCDATGDRIIVAAASAAFAGPGYTMLRQISTEENTQRFRGTFDEVTAGAPNGGVCLSDNGLSFMAAFAGTRDQLWTYDGNDFGNAYPSPRAAPVAKAANMPDNCSPISATGDFLKRAISRDGIVEFQTRTGSNAVWATVGTLTPQGANLTTVELSGSGNRLALATTLGVEIWTGGFGAWVLDQIIGAGSYTGWGRGIGLSTNGRAIFISGDTATNVTAANQAAAYLPQKQFVIVPYTRAS